MPEAISMPITKEEVKTVATAADAAPPADATPEAAATEPAKTTDATAAEADAPAKEATDEAPKPVSLDKFFESYTANGKLSDSDYTELNAMGFPKEVVDTYIAGQSSVMTQADQDALLEKVGGKDGFDAIAKWAGKALSDDELTEFNAMLANKQAAPFALKTLKARMEAEEGRAPAVTLEGGTGNAPAVVGYKTKAEMKEAMRDPRYSSLRRDPAYVKEVEARVAASNL
jgi:hypothetical protein